jgi:hypothetical protein
MQVLRLATLALLAVLVASGCRTAGVGDLARPDPPLATQSSTDAVAILAEHNRNAGRIQVVEARPALTITVSERPNRPTSYSVDGRLAMERPRNFKLDISHTTSKIADIGSNDVEYWFWVKDKAQKAIYYCNYDEAGSSPLAATFQPDWIIEAMGLRIIPQAEAAEIVVTPGPPGTLVLTHRPHTAGGETYTRVTLIDKATHQILEHQIRSTDQKTILARAVVPEGYQRVPLPSSESGTAPETVGFPKRLQLFWVEERLALDATFKSVVINQPIKQSRRELLFVEPELGKDYARVNLAQRPRGTADPTTVRETRPAPPSGVRLGEPAPLGQEDSARDDRGAVALGGEVPTVPSLAEQVVRPRLPTAPEPESLQAENAGWRAATNPGFER